MDHSSPSTERPDWAIQKAQAALNLGMKVPDVEKLLIAKGLNPTAASSVVMSVVEGRVRQDLAPLEADERSKPLHLLLSAVFAIVCLSVVYWRGGGGPTAVTLVCILPGLVGVWLPDVFAWQWGSASKAVGWLWLLVFGIGRLVLVWIANPQ